MKHDKFNTTRYALLLGIAITFNQAHAQVDPTGLLLELTFDGNTQDTSGSGFHMTNFGATPTTDRHGQANSAYTFDGVDDYMRHTGATLNVSDFTLSIWVTVDSFPAWYRYAFAAHSGGGGINNGDRNLGVALANVNQIGGRYTVTEGQNPPAVEEYVDLTPLGTWKHIVYVRDGNEQRLYYQGQLIDTLTDGFGSLNINNGLIEVGAPNYWNGGWSQNGRNQAKWHGGIDDLRLYSRVLSEQEIETLLNEGSDNDGDGIPNDLDFCPDSDLTSMLVIDGCDTGVTNYLFPDGCTLSDAIGEIAANAKNHGAFVKGVTQLANSLKQANLLSGREKGLIVRCAARSSLPN